MLLLIPFFRQWICCSLSVRVWQFLAYCRVCSPLESLPIVWRIWFKPACPILRRVMTIYTSVYHHQHVLWRLYRCFPVSLESQYSCQVLHIWPFMIVLTPVLLNVTCMSIICRFNVCFANMSIPSHSLPPLHEQKPKGWRYSQILRHESIFYRSSLFSEDIETNIG